MPASIPFIHKADDIRLLLTLIHLTQTHARQVGSHESRAALLLSIHEISHSSRHTVALREHMAQQHLAHSVVEVDARDDARLPIILEFLNGIAVLKF